MENVCVDEPVKVGVIFGNSGIIPKWFIWKDRKYQIKETTYTWRDSIGEAKVIHFSVTDGTTLFELSLNQKTLSWRLVKICPSAT